MKTTLKKLAIGLLFTTSVSGFAAQTPETTAEMEAQITVTKGHIDNLVQEIQNTNVTTDFNARDYWNQLPAFQRKVEQTMIDFENRMESEVFSKVSGLIDQYNKVYLSQSFSKSQKEIILKERKENLSNEFEKLSMRYQELIDDVYKLTFANKDAFKGNLILPKQDYWAVKYQSEVTVNYNIQIGSSNKLISKSVNLTNPNCKKSHKCSFNTGIEAGRFGKKSRSYITYQMSKYLPAISPVEFLSKDGYDAVVLPYISSGCQSIICMNLKTADVLSLHELTSDKIDRHIRFKLADKTVVILKSFDSLSYAHYANDPRYDNADNQKSRIKSFIENSKFSTEGLPFDI